MLVAVVRKSELKAIKEFPKVIRESMNIGLNPEVNV